MTANHLGRYLPGNPEIIVENVPGAGSMRLLQLYLGSGATDGSQIIMVSSSMPLAPILDPDNTNFDPRDFKYIASLSNLPSYCVTSVASGIETLDELIAAEVNIGTTGRGATSYAFAQAINGALDAHFNVISGFNGYAEINLAMARGEIQASCGISNNSLAALNDLVPINVVAELSAIPFGVVDGAEFVLDRVADPTTRAALSLVFSSNLLFLPLLVHPDTPDETVAILRDAVAAMANDDDFLAEVAARGAFASVTLGERVQEIVSEILASDETIKQRAWELVQ